MRTGIGAIAALALLLPAPAPAQQPYQPPRNIGPEIAVAAEDEDSGRHGWRPPAQ